MITESELKSLTEPAKLKKAQAEYIEQLQNQPAWIKMEARLKAIADRLPALPNVNHFEAIKAIYLQDRWPGVDVYCLSFLDSLGILNGVDVEAELKKKNKIN